jgi:hypothetical protein
MSHSARAYHRTHRVWVYVGTAGKSGRFAARVTGWLVARHRRVAYGRSTTDQVIYKTKE